MKNPACNNSIIYKVVFLLCVCIVFFMASFRAYAALPASTLNAEMIPAYSGSSYIEIDGNIPGFAVGDLGTEEYVSFGPIDNLGRTTGSSACLGPGTIPSIERSPIGTDIRPSGFLLDKYPDLIESPGFLYNRCHVIGFQLCGDNGSPENLFTGTRYLNTSGMLPFESQVANCIKGTGNHVLYRATPIYRGGNLVADGIQLEAFSVEDGGKSVRFNVFVYNIQPGVLIDYATGKNEIDPNYTASPALLSLDSSGGPENETAAVTRSGEGSAESVAEPDYILNANTKRFHYPWCSSVSDIKEENKKPFAGSREEAISRGYVPCKRCNP